MLATERHQQILTRLQARGAVRTIDLAEEFQVTDETVRRDLQVLADNKQLTRIHGGASSLTGRPMLQSFNERLSINVDKKQLIARVALGLIESGKTYAFDSSTTAFELVSKLPDLPYRVITNAHAVVDFLVRFNSVDVISTGGRFHKKTQTFVGPESMHVLERHNINLAFISCLGLDPDQGASEGFEEQAIFKECLARQAEKTVLLIDSTKLARRSEYFFARIDQIDHLITDADADNEILHKLEQHGCEVSVATKNS